MTGRVTPNHVKNRRVAILAMGIACAMVSLAYASVPLYKIFCQATGFGGTTQVATAAPAEKAQKYITIRFDSNIDSELAWNFRPLQVQQTIKIGEVGMAHFAATSFATAETTGTAMFNVTPVSAGAYFNKIQCFCFTKQSLKPGEMVDLPVQYFVDPAILDDADAKGIHEITLSYTFYPTIKVAGDNQATVKTN